MDNFIETTLNDVVKVHPVYCNINLKNHITDILKKKYEGICSKFGYIKENSITNLKKYSGKLELHTFHGYVLYKISFNAKICNPTIGSIIKCNVKNMNSFGILCVSGFEEKGTFKQVINVIIPKQPSIMLENTEYFESVKLNDDVYVEIIGKRYQLKNEHISAIGKIINNQTNINAKTEVVNNNSNLDDFDDNNDDEDDIIVDDSDDEEVENDVGSDTELSEIANTDIGDQDDDVDDTIDEVQSTKSTELDNDDF